MHKNIFLTEELRIKLQYCLDSMVYSNEALRKQLNTNFNKLLKVNNNAIIIVQLELFSDAYYDKFIRNKTSNYATGLTNMLSSGLSFFLAVNGIHSHQFNFTMDDGEGSILVHGLFCYAENRS